MPNDAPNPNINIPKDTHKPDINKMHKETHKPDMNKMHKETPENSQLVYVSIS